MCPAKQQYSRYRLDRNERVCEQERMRVREGKKRELDESRVLKRSRTGKIAFLREVKKPKKIRKG